MKRILYLILKKAPFDRILSGSKTIEYRDKTDYIVIITDYIKL